MQAFHIQNAYVINSIKKFHPKIKHQIENRSKPKAKMQTLKTHTFEENNNANNEDNDIVNGVNVDHGNVPQGERYRYSRRERKKREKKKPPYII